MAELGRTKQLDQLGYSRFSEGQSNELHDTHVALLLIHR